MAVILDYPGPPTNGQWSTGQIVFDSNNLLWICRQGGVPGTWVGVPSDTNLLSWTSYTPIIGGTGWSLGNGTLTGAYRQMDAKTIGLVIALATGSTTTIGSGDLTLSLPSGATGAAPQYLSGTFYNGTDQWVAVGLVASGSTVVQPFSPYSTSGSNISGITSGISIAVGSSLELSGVIEIQ